MTISLIRLKSFIPTSALFSFARTCQSLVLTILAAQGLISVGCDAQNSPDPANSKPLSSNQSGTGPSNQIPLPAAPASQILDEAGIFSYVPDKAIELEKFLKQLRASHEIEIFVATFGFIEGETIEQRAYRLREVWADDQRGVIIAFESGDSGLSFVANDQLDKTLDRTDIDMILHQAGMEAQRHEGAHNQVTAAAFTLGRSLIAQLDRSKEAAAIHKKKQTLLIGSMLAAILLLVLIGSVINRFIRRCDKRSAEFYYFPSARVGTRFGAPFSGGSSAEIRYKDDS